MAVHRFALALTLVALVGCGGNHGRAKSAYAHGRYLETVERLQRDERQLTQLSPPQQAEHGLYRGLALLQMGDARGAQEWLEFAVNVERRAPGTLRPEDRALLEQGFSRAKYALEPRPPSPYPAAFAAPATRLATPRPD